ncbi:MAG TPA: family 20 glycosylhydrolase [Candidatus Acidoferrales bacterium]
MALGAVSQGMLAQSNVTPNPPTASTAVETLNVVPLPSSFQLSTGYFVIRQNFSVGLTGYTEPRLDRAVSRFLQNLSLETGMTFTQETAEPSKADFVISTEGASKPVQSFDEGESYTLDVNAANAKLSAPNPLGILHGLQTFLQLVRVTPDGFAAPAVHISDRPRFPWRGLMIDVSRHFMPIEVIERNLDGMEAVKLNVFHWHLSDNQGFRVESKEFPLLTKLGSDGEFYTQEQVREVIAYARDRGIRVVPEFDMPGHSTAWFVGYPDLASAPGPYQIERQWGIFDPAMDPARESTYKFLDKFIGEMARLFPDDFFHIGGDEVNGKQWDANAAIQKFRRAHDLKDNAALQAYFTARVQKIVSKHHKTMIGWDEILSPGMPKDIVIQSWRGPDSLASAARLGYQGILSSGYYLDLMWPASQHHAQEPLSGNAATLNPEEQARILGGEACMWSEFATPENIDMRIWPRMAAIAERLWSPEQVQDADSMYRRIHAESQRLEWLGLHQQSATTAMLERAAGTEDIAALRVLADVVEPVKGYAREEAAEKAHVVQTSTDALNRLVDAVPPESAAARAFAKLVDTYISSHLTDADADSQLRAQFTQWMKNDALLEPLLENSYLLKEDIPLSQNLAALGGAGVQALDYIDHSETPPDAWRQQQITAIAEAEKPQADLLLMVAPAVRKLVEASAAVHTNP